MKSNISKIKELKRVISRLIGGYPGKTIHRLGITLGGVWLTSIVFNSLWPVPDQILFGNSKLTDGFHRYRVKKSGGSILLISTNNNFQNNSNKKEFLVNNLTKYRFILMRIKNKDQINFLEFANEYTFKVNSGNKTKTLKEVFIEGNARLTAEIVNKILKLSNNEPNRYIIGNNSAIASIISPLVINPSFQYINSSELDQKRLNDKAKRHELIEKIKTRNNYISRKNNLEEILKTVKTNLRKDELITLIRIVKNTKEESPWDLIEADNVLIK